MKHEPVSGLSVTQSSIFDDAPDFFFSLLFPFPPRSCPVSFILTAAMSLTTPDGFPGEREREWKIKKNRERDGRVRGRGREREREEREWTYRLPVTADVFSWSAQRRQGSSSRDSGLCLQHLSDPPGHDKRRMSLCMHAQWHRCTREIGWEDLLWGQEL